MDDPESTTFIITYAFALLFTWLFARIERTLAIRSQATIESLLDEAKPWGYGVLARATTKRRIVLSLGVGVLISELLLLTGALMAAHEYVSAGQVHPIVAYLVAAIFALVPLAWTHFVLPSTKVFEEIPVTQVRTAAPFVMFWTILCWPIVWPIDRLLTHLGRRPTGREAREEAWLAIVEDDTDEGEIEAEKREMFSSIMSIGETTVKEVMVPRVDVVAIEHGRSVTELLSLFADTQHSRIPIYVDRMDNIIGIVHAKDVLRAAFAGADEDIRQQSVETFARESSLLFVPITKKIDELLRELRREKKHMAIVVDEYGGTAGIITMEDVLEEIVGEIQDEYDEEDELQYRWINEQMIEVEGGMDIADLNEVLGSNLPETNGYDTLGGFLFHQIGAVPEPGAEIRYGRYRMVVRNVTSQRIDTVLIEKLDAADDYQSSEGVNPKP